MLFFSKNSDFLAGYNLCKKVRLLARKNHRIFWELLSSKKLHNVLYYSTNKLYLNLVCKRKLFFAKNSDFLAG